MPEQKPVHENIILGVILIAVLMAAIDSTIVLLAFPAIVNALHSNLATIIWVILVYMLVTAIATTQFGKIGDIYGRSRIFKWGLVIFTIASFLCGIASTDILLIVFRIFQGIGGAMIAATSSAIIADTFERHRIGRAYGYTAMGYNVGAILGIVLGGVITTFIGYRYIFFINVPIGIVALILASKYIFDKKTFKEKLDLSGMVVLGVAVTLLLLGGVLIASNGISALNAITTIVGAILVICFYLMQRRSKSPTIPLDMFSNRVFTNSVLSSFFQGLGFLGVTFMIIMYLQGVRGFSPFYASVLLIPGYVLSGIISPFMGRISDKHGSRSIATLGIAIQIVGVLVYLTISATSSIYVIILGSIIMGIGAAMFWPSNSSAVMANTEPQRFGVASGLLRLFSGIGMMGSFIVVMVTAAFSISRNLAFEIFVGTSKITSSVAGAFVTGMHSAFIAMIVILIIAGITSLTRGKEQRNKEGAWKKK